MINFPNNLWWILPVAIFDLIAKGVALWFSARRGDKIWFLIILVINSAGIVPLIYLIFFDKSSEILKLKKKLLKQK